MTSRLARMHEFHFQPAPESSAQRRADAEERSGSWMTTGIIAAVAAVSVAAAAFGYMRAPALAPGPVADPITRSWQPDPGLALILAKQAATREEAPAVAEPSVAAAPAPVTQPTDSDNPY